jgi:hypothetical protein
LEAVPVLMPLSPTLAVLAAAAAVATIERARAPGVPILIAGLARRWAPVVAAAENGRALDAIVPGSEVVTLVDAVVAAVHAADGREDVPVSFVSKGASAHDV